MMIRSSTGRNRPAIAATGMALLAPVLLTPLAGLWEVGRVAMITNTLNDSAREAARVSASGAFFSGSNHNDPKNTGQTLPLWPPSANGDFEVQKKVLGYLQASGVPVAGATITVANSGSPSTSAKNWSYTWPPAGAISSASAFPGRISRSSQGSCGWRGA
jgi:hypothetical protein